MSSKKKTIIVDFDNTVARSSDCILEIYKKYKGIDFKVDNRFLEWDFEPYIPPEDRDWAIRQFDRVEFYNRLKPADGAIEALTKLSKKYNIVFCTKTENPSTRIKKLYWLDKYFKFKFNVIFVDSFVKSHVKGDIIIDDKIECLQGDRKLKIIFSYTAYNSHPIYDYDSQQFDDGSMITKAKDWKEVLSEIKYFEEKVDKN